MNDVRQERSEQMTWNHRIVRTDHPDWVWETELIAEGRTVERTAPRYRYGVHEAYTDWETGEDGVARKPEPQSWTASPVELWAEDLDTLRAYLEECVAACSLPILDDVASDESSSEVTFTPSPLWAASAELSGALDADDEDKR